MIWPIILAEAGFVAAASTVLYIMGVQTIYGRTRAVSVEDEIIDRYNARKEEFGSEREWKMAKTEDMVRALRELKLLNIPMAYDYRNLYLKQYETKLRELEAS